MRVTADEIHAFTNAYGIECYRNRPCSICGYVIGFLTPAIGPTDRGIVYDHGCNCGSGDRIIRQSSWQELADAVSTLSMHPTEFAKAAQAGLHLNFSSWTIPAEAHGETPDAITAEAIARSESQLIRSPEPIREDDEPGSETGV